MVKRKLKLIDIEDKIKRIEHRAVINPKIRERDNYNCYFCGRNVIEVCSSNTIHHIVPVRYGGEDSLENCITLCLNCHNKLERIYDSLIESLLKKIGDE